MILTDEKREEIRNQIPYSRLPGNTIVIAEEKINLLLSSEQAWREESEKLEKRMKEYELQAIKNINLAEGFEEQLNQAIRVLKGIAETVTVEMDYPSFMPSVTYKAIKIRCESFLSSLKEEA